VSVDDYQFVVWQVVPDRMDEGDIVSIINSRDVDASMVELVKKCLVVIGSHTGPALALHLGVENSN